MISIKWNPLVSYPQHALNEMRSSESSIIYSVTWIKDKWLLKGYLLTVCLMSTFNNTSHLSLFTILLKIQHLVPFFCLRYTFLQNKYFQLTVPAPIALKTKPSINNMTFDLTNSTVWYCNSSLNHQYIRKLCRCINSSPTP